MNVSAFVASLEGERAGKFRVHISKILIPASPDEEFWESTRFLELALDGHVLIFESYNNIATMMGASQEYDCRARSDARESQAKLETWLAEWLELLARPEKEVHVW